MTKIAIFGGTFNPIHIGHLAVAESICEKLKLDELYFVPSHLPPHKSARGVESAEHRYQMVRLSIAGNSKFKVSDFEVVSKGKSYSIDTIRYFKNRFPKNTKLYFIIGRDCLSGLDQWKDIDQIVKFVTFVAVNRAGYAENQSKIKVRDIQTPELLLSASHIRKTLSAGRSVRYLVSDKVVAYIKRYQLYSHCE